MGSKKRPQDDEQEFIDDVDEVYDLLVKTHDFKDITKPPTTRMTFQLLAQFHVIMRDKCERLEARLDHVEQQTAALEKSGIKYGGVYQRANTYSRGTIVTHLGSAWIALKDADVGVVPQDSPDIWQLAIKRGRDGKDASRLPR
ncbi:MAG: hypothetical protein EOS52_23705 [Mesorhizobium sp.]|uniref:hypothetical protein n=1 Tax=Mesorhizobium sp. TaxID=1871066 RepID=UPI000FE93852|nr:hypothetical protein [Mesorhizobium sp.]RWC10778.1 MAG: hypothetical protein EOS52_23705 [Mesorhizobium sp.]